MKRKKEQGPVKVEGKCSQCGKPFSERACGPTHAIVDSYGLELAEQTALSAPPPRKPVEQVAREIAEELFGNDRKNACCYAAGHWRMLPWIEALILRHLRAWEGTK